MHIGLIGTDYEVRHVGGRVVEMHRYVDSDRTRETRLATRGAANGGMVCHRQWRGDTRKLLRLDRIQLVITTQHQRDRSLGALDDECLQSIFYIDSEKFTQSRHCFYAWRGYLLHLCARRWPLARGRDRCRSLDI